MSLTGVRTHRRGPGSGLAVLSGGSELPTVTPQFPVAHWLTRGDQPTPPCSIKPRDSRRIGVTTVPPSSIYGH